jgi:hypothetical protein
MYDAPVDQDAVLVQWLPPKRHDSSFKKSTAYHGTYAYSAVIVIQVTGIFS